MQYLKASNSLCMYISACFPAQHCISLAVFFAGLTLLCWQAMPGAKFSPGRVSENTISARPLSSQRDSDGKFISISGLTAAEQQKCVS